jgi:hypothetical protein
MCPVALGVGEKWGHRCLEIVTKALAPAADGTEWGIALVYSPSGTPALSDDDVVVAGRSVMCETGGSIFAELADMLGPLASSSGGGGDPLVREHDALDAEDDDLPLAAAPADAPGAALVH